MFKYTLSEKFRQKGLSPAAISSEMRNRFDAHFGTCGGISSLNNRLQVRLDTKAIRFFFYTGESTGETVLPEEKYKEIISISLTHVKETGLDILNFDKTAKKKYPKAFFDKEDKENVDTEKKVINQIVEFSNNLAWTDENKPQFSGFPFMDNRTLFKEEEVKEETVNDKNVIEENRKKLFAVFTQCCFLHFILEMENRKCDFAQSPLYDEVRNKLRESFVYQLLCAKIKYTVRLYGEAGRFSEDDYSYVTSKFADLLMDHRINKIISPYNYCHKDRLSHCRQINHGELPQNRNESDSFYGWFYDPEEELEAILEQNRKQEKDGQCTLDENLVRKIRDFLYTKHAVYQAMTKDISKQYFVCAQVLMLFISLSIILSSVLIKYAGIFMHYIIPPGLLLCLSFLVIFKNTDIDRKKIPLRIDECRKDKWFIRTVVLLLILPSLTLIVFPNIPCISFISFLLIIVCPIVWIVRSGQYNSYASSSEFWYAFYPRILVAELVGWLTIGIAEDLVKSMLWIKDWGIIVGAIIIVLVVTGILVGGEAKQHSPYKKTGYIIWSKTLPIVNHSVFFALIIGLVMQVVFYNNLIRTSNVMSDVVFNDYFDKTDYYCQNLVDLTSAVKQYQDYCNISELKDMSLDGKSSNSHTYRITDSIELTITMGLYQKTVNDDKENIEYHNNIVGYYNGIVGELENIYDNKDFDVLNSYKDTIHRLCFLSNSFADSIARCQNLQNIKIFPLFLFEEITCVRRNTLKFKDFDTLMAWATVGNNSVVQTGSAYLDSLTIRAREEHKCCRNIIVPFWGEKRIFPTLLIFHTLIVLVLAFVTQLIISDKSVTEPL